MRQTRSGATNRGESKWRLKARPATPSRGCRPGIHKLGVAETRDTLLYVPPTFREDGKLVVALHGAAADAEQGISLLRAQADESGFAIVAPASREFSWDLIVRDYGPDVKLIDEALHAAFDRCAVRQSGVAISGFSDGASYALSLGLANGDLFGHVLAFSPGFMAPPSRHGEPRIFISHGTRDTVLPADRCSRRIVASLRESGYPFVYKEFEGPHTVPDVIKAEAIEWWRAD